MKTQFPKKRIILISPKIGLHLERKTNQILANNYASQRKGQQNQTKTIANQTDSPLNDTTGPHLYNWTSPHETQKGGTNSKLQSTTFKLTTNYLSA